jgi:hypothetical protein
MEMKQMLARLMVQLRTDQEEVKEKMKTNQAKTDANQEKMVAKLDTNLKEIIAEMCAWRKEKTAFQESTEACLETSSQRQWRQSP